jgi:glycosyltransferase involved in cell wall biosynthesis
MKKPKVLIFIDWYLPGYKAGGPIQSVANLISNLKDDFEFSVVTSNTDYCETVAFKNIKSDEWNTIDNGTRVFYFSKNKLSPRAINKVIKNESPDFVYLNGIYSLYYTLLPLFFLRNSKETTTVVAARGMLSEGSLGVKSKKKKLFLLLAKIFKLFTNVTFHATNDNEKIDIQKAIGKNATIKVAGNLPQKANILVSTNKTKEEGKIELVNIARISPEKNLLFAIEVLSLVKRNVHFTFYGPIYNDGYWQLCKKEIQKLPSNVTTHYGGSIEPTMVSEALTKAHFLFMPSTGENFGHIILQSFASGIPVIISDTTPWKNLEEKNIGVDLPLNNKLKMAESIDKYANMNNANYIKMSNDAFSFASKYASNPILLDQNKQLFM